MGSLMNITNRFLKEKLKSSVFVNHWLANVSLQLKKNLIAKS